MIMHNEFEGRDEVIFIEYDKVIKNSDQFLITKLSGELSHLYSSMLETESLKNINRDNALGLSSVTVHHNIFESLRKDDLPESWIHSYKDLYTFYPEMFKECSILSIGANLHMMSQQKFTKRIIFWSPFKDDRIVEDIQSRHGNLKNLEYIPGNLNEVFELVGEKITTFIIANHELLPIIKGYKDLNYTEILLANYRFNSIRVNGDVISRFDEEFFEGSEVKFSLFEPFKPNINQFNQIIKND